MDDAIAIRCYVDPVNWEYGSTHALLRELARCAVIPIISMEDDVYHPCQGLANMLTVQEECRGFSGDYFAYPNSAWERATNEDTNGLIRKYFPNILDIVALNHKDVETAKHRLNNCPRKCLGFNTPNKLFINHRFVTLGS